MRDYWAEISGRPRLIKPVNSITWEFLLEYASFEILSEKYDDVGLAFGQIISVVASGEYELDLRESGIKSAYAEVFELSIPDTWIEVTTYSDSGRDEREDIPVPRA